MNRAARGSPFRAGVTLLELLVGLALMGAALALGQAAFVGIADHRERAVHGMQETARTALVRRTMLEWLRRTRLEGRAPFVGMDRATAGRPDDRIAFLTDVLTAEGWKEAVVHLRIDWEPASPEQGLVAVVIDIESGATERIELAPNAVGLDIRYLFGSGAGQWYPSWISSSIPPRAVRLAVFADPEQPLPALLRHPILATVGGAR